jgi:alanine racemase
MIMKKFRINYENIKHNIIYIKKKCNKKIMFVVKDNAYNMGLIKTVEATKNYADYYGVNEIEEALEIRNNFKSVKILVMNPLEESELITAKNNNIDVSITSLNYFYNNLCILEDMRLHLKINIGMNRFGLNNGYEIEEILQSKIRFIGVFTHFPQADEQNLTTHNIHVNMWLEYYKKYFYNYKFEYIHCENSACIINGDSRLHMANMVRIGILGYGYSPMQKVKSLLPALYVSAKIIAINELKPGDYLGYSTTYKATKNETIAIINIGYGSGILKNRIKHPVYINQKYYNCLNITMSHLFIAVNKKEVHLFDEVEIYGDNILVDDVNRSIGLTCSLQMSYLNIKY